MLARLRETIVNSYIYRRIAPSIFSLVKAISSAGQTLLFTQKFIFYLTGNKKSIANIPTSSVLVVCTLASNYFIRRRLIDRQFDPEAKPYELQIEITPGIPIHITYDHLETFGKSFFWIIKILGYLASISSAGYNYLCSAVFLESIVGAGGYDIHDESYGEISLQLFAILCAISNLVASFSNSQHRIEENAILFAYMLEKRLFKWNHYMTATLGIATLGTICIPFFTNYSTNTIYGKIPKIVVPKGLKVAINSIAVTASTTSFIMSNFPDVYRTIKPGHKNYRNHLPKDKKGKAKMFSIFGTGIGEAGSTGAGNYLGTVETLHELFGLDKKDPGVIAFGISTSLSSAALFYSFAIYQGYLRVLSYEHEKIQKQIDSERVAFIKERYENPRNILPKLNSRPIKDADTSSEEDPNPNAFSPM